MIYFCFKCNWSEQQEQNSNEYSIEKQRNICMDNGGDNEKTQTFCDIVEDLSSAFPNKHQGLGEGTQLWQFKFDAS